MSILVTGGAGYIGSHTCVELLGGGYDVIVIDNFSNSKPMALQRVEEITNKKITVYEGNLLDKQLLTTVFSRHNIEAVIHFAGLKSVGDSVTLPLNYYQTNVAGTLQLCEVMEQFGVRKFVFSSSATVYGFSNCAPFSEDLPLQAMNPYGRTKLICEQFLSDLCHSNHKWSISLLRYFNPIGAHPSGLIGEDPNGIPTNLVPYISQVAVGKLKELKVFGNDYPTHDGTGVRDYIHVVDLANGHLKALERVVAETGISAYNLGKGRGYSVLEVIAAFEAASKKAIPYSFVSKRPGDIAISFANPEKAQRELQWKATRDINDMCIDTWRWQSINLNGYDLIPPKKILSEKQSSGYL